MFLICPCADIALDVGLGPAHGPTGSQARMELFAQRSTALDEQRLVDGLVGHLHLRAIGVFRSQPRGDLLGRPPGLELALDHPAEPPALGQLGPLGSQRPPTRRPIGHQSPVLLPAAVSVHLPAHRRGRAAQGFGDGTDGVARRQASRSPRALRAIAAARSADEG